MSRRSRRRKRNPNQYTTDEARASGVIYSEGTPECLGRYPYVTVRMCIKKGLQPISKALNVPIGKDRVKRVKCPPEHFPPDGKGQWRTRIPIRKLRKLLPLIPQEYRQDWQESWKKHGCPPK